MALVTRAQKAVHVRWAVAVGGAEEAIPVRLVIVHIALGHISAADAHFAVRAGRQLLAPLIEHAHLDAVAIADRAGLARAGRQRVGRHLVRCLGHRVRLEHGRLKRLLKCAECGCTERRGAGTHKAQIRQGVGPWRVQQDLVDRRHRRVPVGAMVHELVPERARAKPRRQHDAAAGKQRGEQAAEQAVHVEERHHNERLIGRTQLVRLLDVVHRRRQVPVRQRHRLGPAGGAGRVQHQRRVLRVRLLLGAVRERLPVLVHELHLRVLHVEHDLGHAHTLGAARAHRGLGSITHLAATQRPGRYHEQLGLCIVQVEAHLALLVVGVQWRGNEPLRRRRKEHADKLGAVDKAAADRGATRNAAAGDLALQLGGARLQLCVGELELVAGGARHLERDRIELAALAAEQLGVERGHCGVSSCAPAH